MFDGRGIGGRAAHQDAGPGDGLEAARLVHRRVVGGEGGVDVPRHVELVEHDAGVLHGVVGVEQLAAHDGGAGVALYSSRCSSTKATATVGARERP